MDHKDVEKLHIEHILKYGALISDDIKFIKTNEATNIYIFLRNNEWKLY